MTTVQDLVNKIDMHIRDTSTNSVSQADRFRAIAYSIHDIMNEFPFDHMIVTTPVYFFDTVNYYKMNDDVTDIVEPTDLRRDEDVNTVNFVRKNSREVAQEIADGFGEPSFAIDRQDRDTYLAISYDSPYTALVLHDCDSTSANGSWVSDATNSDATVTTADASEFKEGSGSIRFDVDVSQSGNNRATIENSSMAAVDLSDVEDLASFIFWAYLPTVTSSFTVYWGSDSTNYWSGTTTTDLHGDAFSVGWNECKVDWANATKTSLPNVSAIDYLRIDVNYGAGFADDTHFRIDDIRMVRPEKLIFHYQSQVIGFASNGTTPRTTAFLLATDIPFYSDQYDYFNEPVSRRSAAILFELMGLTTDADRNNAEYFKSIRDLRKRFPTSQLKETQSFKIQGLNQKNR